MSDTLFHMLNTAPVDILVQMNADLSCLVEPVQPGPLYKYCFVENKKVLFVFHTSPRVLEKAYAVGIRSALVIKTGRSCHPALLSGDVLLLDAPNGAYETRLLKHLAPGFGVKRGICSESPQRLPEMRLLGFRVAVSELPQDAARMKEILNHLLVCTTADL